MTIPNAHTHVIMTQMSVRKGIKRFGDKSYEALLKELNQLHQCDALLPMMSEEMSHKEKKKELHYFKFLKEKCDGSIKARGCSYGQTQREYRKNPTQALPQYH